MDSPHTSGANRAQAVVGCGGAEASQPPAARTKRLRGLLVAAGCWSVLAVAFVLTPHGSGTGTHQELGMPSCSFLARTGLPCPTCGLTTSVSAMAHARIALAWQAHPFGPVLFVALAALAFAATAEAATGRNVLSRLRLGWLAWVLLFGIPAGWALRLILGLADGSLPMR